MFIFERTQTSLCCSVVSANILHAFIIYPLLCLKSVREERFKNVFNL